QTGTVGGIAVSSIEYGLYRNFAMPAEYLSALQSAKRELRPFMFIPRAKLRSTLLDRIGNERPLAGVVGENFTWGFGGGKFSLSLHNRLPQGVSRVHGSIIFYNPEGEPLDSWPIDYEGTIPARAAKQIGGEASEDMYYFLYWWDKRARVWRKADTNREDIHDT